MLRVHCVLPLDVVVVDLDVAEGDRPACCRVRVERAALVGHDGLEDEHRVVEVHVEDLLAGKLQDRGISCSPDGARAGPHRGCTVETHPRVDHVSRADVLNQRAGVRDECIPVDEPGLQLPGLSVLAVLQHRLEDRKPHDRLLRFEAGPEVDDLAAVLLGQVGDVPRGVHLEHDRVVPTVVHIHCVRLHTLQVVADGLARTEGIHVDHSVGVVVDAGLIHDMPTRDTYNASQRGGNN